MSMTVVEEMGVPIGSDVACAVDERHEQTPQPYSPVKRNSACQGPSEWTTSQ